MASREVEQGRGTKLWNEWADWPLLKAASLSDATKRIISKVSNLDQADSWGRANTGTLSSVCAGVRHLSSWLCNCMQFTTAALC